MSTAKRRPRSQASASPIAPRLVLVGGTEGDRSDRIEAVRRRIRSGYYERRDIRDSLARAVIDALRDDD